VPALLPVGKLPVNLLHRVLSQAPVDDARLLLGPGIGLDCAVLDFGPSLLVLKSDPITFATDEIGWYAVQVNANDIATTGALPRWMLVTLLLPEGSATPDLVEAISQQVFQACRAIGVSVIGGHSEITFALDRPILVGTMIGEVERHRLITPQGANPGDRLLVSKGVPIEATAILARQFPERLEHLLSPAEIQQAQDYLYDPGISVLRDAQVAVSAGQVTAMHDPTEGGLLSALWELAEASHRTLVVDPVTIPVPPLSARLCDFFGINPLAAIASGALLMTAPASEVTGIRLALEQEGISCAEIGLVEAGLAEVWQMTGAGRAQLPRPERDEIARLFEA